MGQGEICVIRKACIQVVAAYCDRETIGIKKSRSDECNESLFTDAYQCISRSFCFVNSRSDKMHMITKYEIAD